MAQDMEAIVAFADQLQSVNTEGVPITAHIAPLKRDAAGRGCPVL